MVDKSVAPSFVRPAPIHAKALSLVTSRREVRCGASAYVGQHLFDLSLGQGIDQVVQFVAKQAADEVG